MQSFLQFAESCSEGWSLLAVKAPHTMVAEALKQLPEVTEYQGGVVVAPMKKNPKTGLFVDEKGKLIGLLVDNTSRTCFLVQPKDCNWCVLYRTAHWCEIKDIQWTKSQAEAISSGCSTQAVALLAGGNGAECVLYEAGAKVKTLGQRDNRKVLKFLDELQLSIVDCFPGGSPTRLYAVAAQAEQITAIDRVVIQVR